MDLFRGHTNFVETDKKKRYLDYLKPLGLHIICRTHATAARETPLDENAVYGCRYIYIRLYLYYTSLEAAAIV